VGSAVNDTTRELGGALGIAILGSIANTAYRAGISLSGIGLTAATRHQAEEAIGAAGRIASAAPGAGLVHDRAASGFTNRFNTASAVSVGLVVVLAAVLLWSTRSPGDEPVVEVDGFGAELEPQFALVPASPGERTE